MAITWRNVQGDTGHSTAAGILNSGGRAVNAGFDNLNQILAQRQATENHNWNNTKQNNTNAVQDFISGLGDVDAAIAARDSGAVNQMIQGYGAQVDRGALRGALDNRISGLRNDFLQGVEYDDKTTAIKERPLVDQLNTAILNGDKATFQQILADNELRNESQYHQGWDTRAQDLLGREREGIRFSREGASHNSAMANAALQRELNTVRLGQARDEATAATRGREIASGMGLLGDDYIADRRRYLDGMESLSKDPEISQLFNFRGGRYEHVSDAASDEDKRRNEEYLLSRLSELGDSPEQTVRNRTEQFLTDLGIPKSEQGAYIGQVLDSTDPRNAMSTKQRAEYDALVNAQQAEAARVNNLTNEGFTIATNLMDKHRPRSSYKGRTFSRGSTSEQYAALGGAVDKAVVGGLKLFEGKESATIPEPVVQRALVDIGDEGTADDFMDTLRGYLKDGRYDLTVQHIDRTQGKMNALGINAVHNANLALGLPSTSSVDDFNRSLLLRQK